MNDLFLYLEWETVVVSAQLLIHGLTRWVFASTAYFKPLLPCICVIFPEPGLLHSLVPQSWAAATSLSAIRKAGSTKILVKYLKFFNHILFFGGNGYPGSNKEISFLIFLSLPQVTYLISS